MYMYMYILIVHVPIQCICVYSRVCYNADRCNCVILANYEFISIVVSTVFVTARTIIYLYSYIINNDSIVIITIQ